jgi:hypothetical protein
MPKHVSGDTDVDTTVQNIKQLYGCLYTVLSPFLLLKNIPFGLGDGWDLRQEVASTIYTHVPPSTLPITPCKYRHNANPLQL